MRRRLRTRWAATCGACALYSRGNITLSLLFPVPVPWCVVRDWVSDAQCEALTFGCCVLLLSAPVLASLACKLAGQARAQSAPFVHPNGVPATTASPESIAPYTPLNADSP